MNSAIAYHLFCLILSGIFFTMCVINLSNELDKYNRERLDMLLKSAEEQVELDK